MRQATRPEAALLALLSETEPRLAESLRQEIRARTTLSGVFDLLLSVRDQGWAHDVGKAVPTQWLRTPEGTAALANVANGVGA
jgi:hypothetical protein